jgi:hypothetical protein
MMTRIAKVTIWNVTVVKTRRVNVSVRRTMRKSMASVFPRWIQEEAEKPQPQPK